MCKSYNINGVAITVDGDLRSEEVVAILDEECEQMLHSRKQELASVHITALNDGELEIVSKPKSCIKRVRRITGYLSEIENFNSAKKAEAEDRIVHIF